MPSTKWVSRTYVYSEPVEHEHTEHSADAGTNGDAPNAESVTVALRGAGSKSDYDAGYDAGYRAGWVAGYGVARHGNGPVN